MTTDARTRARSALVTTATVVAYYGLPDVVHHRTARGFIKAGLLVAGAASTLPSRAELDELRASWSDALRVPAPEGTAPDGTAPDGTAPDGTAPDGTAPDGTATTDDGLDVAARRRVRAGAVVAAGTIAAVTTLATVAGERWIYRRGEARAAAGVKFAHTRGALVMAGISALLTVVADVAEARSGTPDPS